MSEQIGLQLFLIAVVRDGHLGLVKIEGRFAGDNRLMRVANKLERIVVVDCNIVMAEEGASSDVGREEAAKTDDTQENPGIQRRAGAVRHAGGESYQSGYFLRVPSYARRTFRGIRTCGILQPTRKVNIVKAKHSKA